MALTTCSTQTGGSVLWGLIPFRGNRTHPATPWDQFRRVNKVAAGHLLTTSRSILARVDAVVEGAARAAASEVGLRFSESASVGIWSMIGVGTKPSDETEGEVGKGHGTRAFRVVRSTRSIPHGHGIPPSPLPRILQGLGTTSSRNPKFGDRIRERRAKASFVPHLQVRKESKPSPWD